MQESKTGKWHRVRLNFSVCLLMSHPIPNFIFTFAPLGVVFKLYHREYARGRRERRNRFRPADVAFFSLESDKNVALIFRKIRCFNIHFNIHMCHQLVFDLGRSSTCYPSGLHKKSIRGRGPVWEGSCFPAKN